MISNKTIELVKSNDLFKGLDFNSLNIPFDARNFQEYKEGDLIYSSGEPSEFVCLLINGEVKIKLKSVKRLFLNRLMIFSVRLISSRRNQEIHPLWLTAIV